MKVIRASFIPTAGHGYLMVPRQDVHVVGFEPSPYSTSDATNYFLEEDCDAGAFIAEAQREGFTVEISEARQDSVMDDYIDYVFENA